MITPLPASVFFSLAINKTKNGHVRDKPESTKSPAKEGF